MNKKVKHIASWLAAAVFLFALAINVKVTLDDPFSFMSTEAIATGDESSGGTSSGICGTSYFASGCLFPCVENPAYQYGETSFECVCLGTGTGTCQSGAISRVYSCNGTMIETGEINSSTCR